MNTVDKLSVFFPAYNEESNISTTAEKALGVLKSLPLKEYEVIIVDDGSKDRTGEIADNIANKYPHVRVVHQSNGGYGMALRGGFGAAKYDWIVYTDADGQFDFSEVNKFLDKTDEAEIIYGYRMKRRDPFFRTITAKGWAVSVWIFFQLWLKDVDCGFKMIHRKVLERIPSLRSTRGGMINAELAIKAKQAGFVIAQVGVNHYPRRAGTPTGVKPRVILQSYLDLFNLWLNNR